MEKEENKPSEAIVEVITGGPLRISGNFILKDLKRGDESTPGEIWLCRCGKSSNKPYCDGSHRNK
ncbi:MAG TPA: CDGSH iron-sulfur domain-containing protein [Bacteroidales bacterium]|nr:CDGSH iron-sulfur domain-containing protein [Bacteroidales bacterium]HPF03698.1 CDGSH iron-sulfur domain-containing protein [Bacteroidales bacterium]HPJ60132.1 CDGSH iron-sulfur domain-containing protein [Bacteroidales bacterium]HPR11987.1 CDGSH iron-sulfur domain-containing protein [Bacteroidales bacterium]HRW86405.1 CDGSH iron-sulfur domain-containing protein [Bacteroidales bacterium]